MSDQPDDKTAAIIDGHGTRPVPCPSMMAAVLSSSLMRHLRLVPILRQPIASLAYPRGRSAPTHC